VEAFARRRGVTVPYAGLLTAALTEPAETAVARRGPLIAMAIATVGLSNRITAGVSPAAEGEWGAGAPEARLCGAGPPWPEAAEPGTINAIVIVDGDAEPAALVNALMTVTQVKMLALVEAGVKGAEGHVATGTSTDAVVIAATQRGVRQRFGGPVSHLGWVVAQAAGAAFRRGIARWLAEHPA
jgi:adenosylcobinamide amidohydrolase